MIVEEEKKVEVIDVEKPAGNAEKSEFKVSCEQPKTSKSIAKYFAIFIAILFIIFLIIFGAFSLYAYNNEKIAKGIYISGIDVSNLSRQEALEKLQKYYNEKLSTDLVVVHGEDYKNYIKTSEIDVTFDLKSAVNYAYSIGKNGNIFEDDLAVFDAMINGKNITPTFTLDDESLTTLLSNMSKELPDTIVESSYYIEDSNLIITKGSSGNVVDTEKTIASIKLKVEDLSYINEEIELSTKLENPSQIDLQAIYDEVHKEPVDAYYTNNPFVVHPSENGVDFKVSMEEAQSLLDSAENECTIPLKTLKPSVTTNMIGSEAFPDLLATFSTNYATSNTNRTTNLRLAANKINGYVLLPGETFSYNKVVGKRSIEAGYKEAAVYENGQVVQGIGGGICQISTTLFNCALLANLDIVELHNHQFVPSYVKAGRDATVVYGSKDFKFKNSRKYAIKINCSVSGGVATFKIFGVRESTEYDISIVANVTSKTSTYIKSSTSRVRKLNGQTVNSEHIANFTYKVH